MYCAWPTLQATGPLVPWSTPTSALFKWNRLLPFHFLLCILWTMENITTNASQFELEHCARKPNTKFTSDDTEAIHGQNVRQTVTIWLKQQSDDVCNAARWAQPWPTHWSLYQIHTSTKKWYNVWPKKRNSKTVAPFDEHVIVDVVVGGRWWLPSPNYVTPTDKGCQ